MSKVKEAIEKTDSNLEEEKHSSSENPVIEMMKTSYQNLEQMGSSWKSPSNSSQSASEYGNDSMPEDEEDKYD